MATTRQVEAIDLTPGDVTTVNGRVAEVSRRPNGKIELGFVWGRLDDQGRWWDDPEGSETGAWEPWDEFWIYEPRPQVAGVRAMPDEPPDFLPREASYDLYLTRQQPDSPHPVELPPMATVDHQTAVAVCLALNEGNALRDGFEAHFVTHYDDSKEPR